MIAIVLFIILLIWILLTKSAMKIGRYLFRRFRPDNPRAEKWGAFWGFMLAMGWVLVYWTVEAIIVRIYAAEMCKQAGITVYVTPEQWRSLTKESADNLRKNAPFYFENNSIIFDGHKFDRINLNYIPAGISIYTFISKEINYTTMRYEIFLDNNLQVILFKSIRVSTRYAPAGSSYKFWIDNIPSCGNDSFDYLNRYLDFSTNLKG